MHADCPMTVLDRLADKVACLRGGSTSASLQACRKPAQGCLSMLPRRCMTGSRAQGHRSLCFSVCQILLESRPNRLPEGQGAARPPFLGAQQDRTFFLGG